MFRKQLFGNFQKSHNNSNKSISSNTSAPGSRRNSTVQQDSLINTHNASSNSTLNSCGSPNAAGESNLSPRGYNAHHHGSSRSAHHSHHSAHHSGNYSMQSTMMVINQQRVGSISEYIQFALAPATHLPTSTHTSFSIGGSFSTTSSFSTATTTSSGGSVRSYAGVNAEGKLDVKLVERLLLAPRPIEIQDEELKHSLEMMEVLERLLKTAGIQPYEWIEFTGREDESKKISIGGQKVLSKKLPFDRFTHEFNRLSQDIQHMVYEEPALKSLFHFITNRDSEDEDAYVDHCNCDIAMKKYQQFNAKLRKFEGVKLQLQDIGSFMRKFQMHLSPLTANIGRESQAEDSTKTVHTSIFISPSEMEKLIANILTKYDTYVAENGPLDTSNMRPLEEEAIFQSVSGKSFLLTNNHRQKKYSPSNGNTPSKRTSITMAIASTLQAISSSIGSSFLSTSSSLTVSSKVTPTLSIESEFDEDTNDDEAFINNSSSTSGKPPLSPHRANKASKQKKNNLLTSQNIVDETMDDEPSSEAQDAQHVHKRARSYDNLEESEHVNTKSKHTFTSSSMAATTTAPKRKPQLMAEEDDSIGFEGPSTDDASAFTASSTSNNMMSASWKFFSWKYSSSASTTTASTVSSTGSKIHPVSEEGAVY